MSLLTEKEFDTLFLQIVHNNSNDIALKEPVNINDTKQYSLSEQIGGAVFIAVSLPDAAKLNWENDLCSVTKENKTYKLNQEAYYLLQQFNGRHPLIEIIALFIGKEDVDFVLENDSQDLHVLHAQIGTGLCNAISKMIKHKLIIYLHSSFSATGTKSYHTQPRLSDWGDDILSELISFTSSGALYKHITYRDMNSNIRYIANEIAQYKLDPNSVVAISAKSRLHLSIAVLAVIYSGHVFTCIYPDFSKGHRKNIVINTKASLIISDYDHELDFVPHINISLSAVYHYDELAGANTNDSEVLYICSTSGTTGTPKYINVTKYGMCNYLSYRRTHYALNKNNNTLQLLTETSDVFWGSLFLALISEGSVVFCDFSKKADYEQTCKIIENNRISNFCATPRMLETLLEVSEPGQLNTLEFVIIGGEPVSNTLFDNLSKHQSSVRLINEFGATETTIACCADPDFSSKSIYRIGQPISHTQCLIVDEVMQCVPDLVHGEILVAGASLAKDLDDSELCEIDGNVYYRTGDIGYSDHDGYFYYVKRKYSEMKINGMRVDINQIEAIIRDMEGVKSVKALVIDTQINQKVAVFINSDRHMTETAILECIRENIYLYAVPIQIIFVGNLPINTNGKVDTEKLRALLNQELEMEPIMNKAIEDIVHTYWCKYLEVDEIEQNTEFFEAGGNSILLTKMYKDMKDNLFSGLKLTDFFVYPTIEKFAEYLKLQNIT